VDPEPGPETRTAKAGRFLPRLALTLAVLFALGAAVFWVTLPDVRPLRTQWPKTTAFMERRKAELKQAGQSDRLEWTPVPLSAIAPELARLAVLAEDSRFRQHGGVDWDAVREAAKKNYEKGKLKVGGSSITQQLAKNLYLSPARNPWRKLRELAIAWRLERALGKQRILELYLNVIEFGRRTYGAEAAARRYFQKAARDLDRDEAALLAAVIPSPRIYDLERHRDRAERRARRILDRERSGPD
jgi:monofunctional biosynthetic peptidoglycan transglycosylase